MGDLKEFVGYVLSFYGEGGIYQFSSPATKDEVLNALRIRDSNQEDVDFEGDSFDREIIRDVMLSVRDANVSLEHEFVSTWVAKSK